MSTPTTSPVTQKAPLQAHTIRVVSHTALIYWWPVWLVGLILAGLTYVENTRLAIVPSDTQLREVESDKTYELTISGKPTASLTSAAAAGAKAEDPFPVRIAHTRNLGLVYVVVVLLVIVGSNVPLRGAASVVGLLCILLVTVVLAYLDWLDRIFDYVGGLHIDISLAGYLFPSLVLLVAWLATVFWYDPLRYMVFTPGQFVLHKEVGDLREVYDTTQVVAEKKRTDLFRHWVLGFGAGDLVIKVPSQALQIELPNVLFIDRRVTEIANLMKTKPVMAQ